MFSAAEKHDGMTKWASKQSELVGLPRGVLLSNRNLALERNLDILVFTDLGMDTKTSMWAATRLAAVQICFWGHPTTTGMPSMDYFVTADNFEADTHSSRFSEQLIRFDSPSFFFHFSFFFFFFISFFLPGWPQPRCHLTLARSPEGMASF